MTVVADSLSSTGLRISTDHFAASATIGVANDAVERYS